MSNPTLKVEPTKDIPLPYDLIDEKASSALEELAIAANTIEAQIELGATLELNSEDQEKQKTLIEAAVKNKRASAITSPNTAFAAAAFLRTYGQHLALDVAALRAAVTNKLMEIANCGDPRYELKALELLGKHSDVGLFTERSEVTINYKNPEALEAEIRERVKRLLNASVIETVPLDDELGPLEPPPARLGESMGLFDEE